MSVTRFNFFQWIIQEPVNLSAMIVTEYTTLYLDEAPTLIVNLDIGIGNLDLLIQQKRQIGDWSNISSWSGFMILTDLLHCFRLFTARTSIDFTEKSTWNSVLWLYNPSWKSKSLSNWSFGKSFYSQRSSIYSLLIVTVW